MKKIEVMPFKIWLKTIRQWLGDLICRLRGRKPGEHYAVIFRAKENKTVEFRCRRIKIDRKLKRVRCNKMINLKIKARWIDLPLDSCGILLLEPKGKKDANKRSYLGPLRDNRSGKAGVSRMEHGDS